jgi:hypothetical protein
VDKQEGKLIDTVGERPSVSKPKTITKHPGGRPTLYSRELGLLICSQVAEGKSLRSICRQEDMPATSSVFLWLHDYPEFSEHYAKAKSSSADAFFEDIVELADKVLNGQYEPQAARVALDAKKWAAAKLKPKVYGEQQRESTGPTINFNLPSQKYLADDVKQAINEAQVSQIPGEIPNTITTDDINEVSPS